MYGGVVRTGRSTCHADDVQVDYTKGDYRTVAERLLPAARRLVAQCAPGAGQRVVDVATGSGNVAHLCRARGAQVVAVDLEVQQLRLGRRDDDGISWLAGDAVALPLQDGVADQVLSTFGLIFAPDPARAVEQAARVCRSGGLLGLATWSGHHLQRAQYDVMGAVLPDLRGGHDPLATWGSEAAVAERLRPVADHVTVERGVLTRTYASVEAWWEDRSRTAPPVVTARQHLDDEEFARLGALLRQAVQPFARPVADGLELDDEYLLVVARLR